MSHCKKFAPNIFYKSKCSNCFRQKDEHSPEALECNRATRSVARNGYLFVAPDWDFSVPLNRTKRWQRRWFVLYDDGELNYSVDEHPETVPQGSVDMCQILEVTGAEEITGHQHSLALTGPDRVTFIKAASREDAKCWAELLAVFPRRHKRNATFPGGRASPSLHQLGRSSSPQPARPRHLSCLRSSTKANYFKMQSKELVLKEEKLKTKPFEDTLPIEIEEIQNIDCTDSGSAAVVDTESSLVPETKISSELRVEPEPEITISVTGNNQFIDTPIIIPSEDLQYLKKGWLWLQNGEEWTRKWVVLCCQFLNIFQEQDEDNTPEFSIETFAINECVEICARRKYCFQILSTNYTLTLSAVTAGTRSSWMCAVKKVMSSKTSTSSFPLNMSRSTLLSSDEEYRTASEGGRRGSEDWSELPSSPHFSLGHTSLNKLKDRVRNRARLPKCSSRQSTLDSTSTEEFESGLMEQEKNELQNVINKQNVEIEDLQKQLKNAHDKTHCLEIELERVKNESQIQNERHRHKCEVKEKENNRYKSNLEDKIFSLQEQLSEAQQYIKKSEEKCNALNKDLQSKQDLIIELQEEVNSLNEKLVKNSQNRYECLCKNYDSDSRNNCNRLTLVNSLADLTNINLDVDFEDLNNNELIELCLDIKSRFEKAVAEIRAMKKELRESYAKYDNLELKNFCLKRDLEVGKQEAQAEVTLMAIRLDHLTTKLANAEKQLRIKSKQDFKERRSLSLKGGENSFNKEIEDKILELETKIMVLEKNNSKRKYRRDRSNERNSPIDDKSLRRLRRRSLEDSSAVDPIKVLIRLDSLENKVTGINDPNDNTSSNTSLNISNDGCLCRLSDENFNLKTWIKVGEKIKQCLNQVNIMKSYCKTKNYKDKIACVENNLREVESLLFCQNCNTQLDELNNSASSVVKQLQSLLLQKLISIAEKKRLLRESNKLDTIAHLEILAEKVAYENVLIGRIQHALTSTVNEETFREHLLSKEIKETEFLLLSLQNKLNGMAEKNLPTCKTSAEYLTKVLTQFLTISIHRCNRMKNDNLLQKNKFSFVHLLEEQNRVNTIYKVYKTNKLPILAETLAMQAICLASDKSCVLHTLNQDLIKDFNTIAHDTINAELILSEINHVLLRAAQQYEANMNSDYTFCFSFFAHERAVLELWVESVENNLYVEINKSITELTEYYQNYLNKLKVQNWRNSIKLENINVTSLLNEFADIVAHKALIDARINVLLGQCNYKNVNTFEGERLELHKKLEYDKLLMDLEDHSLVQINQSLEAEFKCMLEKYTNKCLVTLDNTVFSEVLKNLHNLSNEIDRLQGVLKVENSESFENLTIENWCDVCHKCQQLRDQVEYIRDVVSTKFHTLFDNTYKLENIKNCPRNYLSQVNSLRMVYKNIVKTCEKEHLRKIEHLHSLWEQVLFAVENWFYCTIQNMKESHSLELKVLQQEKERALAEETQATLAALDAMQKAHEAEVQKEIAKFKENFIFQQKSEILNLSEKLAMKNLEASALEEQLCNITKQLVQAHQHILKLQENPQESPVQ